MNTLKKILLLVLTMSLLACVTFSFASCTLPGGSTDETNDKDDKNEDDEDQDEDNQNSDDSHCPADCECRDEDLADIPDGYHCSNNCECREEDINHIPDDYHCPDECECRADEGGEPDDEPGAPEHCPDDCECRINNFPTDTTPKNYTYLVVVRDDQGNIVSGVDIRITDGKSTLSKQTDETGTLAFSLTQGTWEVIVENAPAGYVFDKSQKYQFTAEGVCAIELSKPVGYTFVAKSAYDDTPFAEVFVSLYAWNAEIEDYDWDEAVATGTTDAEGKVTLEVLAGKYIATFFVGDNNYATELEIDIPTDVFEVEIMDNEGYSENNPIRPEDTELYPWLANGTVIWYSVMMADNRTIVIDDADAFVIYNGETYYPDEEDGHLEVALVEDYSFNICFAIGYASDDEEAEEYKEIFAALVAPLGSYYNPIVLDDIADLDTVTLEENEEGNAIWYKWTPTFNGRIFLLCDNENNLIAINDGTVYSDANEGAAFVQFDVKPYVDIYISVAATSTNVEVVTGTNPYTGEEFSEEMEVTKYVAAELDIDSLALYKYVVEVNGADGNPLAGETVTITDAEGNVVANLITDVAGKVETLLPEGEYTVASTIPAGYNTENVILAEGERNAYVSAFPYNFAMLPTQFMPGGSALKVDVPAGATYYYMLKISYDTTLTLMGADGASFNYTGSDAAMDMWGNLVVTLLLETADEYSNFVYFSITNNDAENDATYYAQIQANVPGMEWENALEANVGETNTADVNLEILPSGAVFYKFIAPEDGIIKISTIAANASFSVGNTTSGKFLDITDADEYTNEENPLVIKLAVAKDDVVQIVVSTNNYESGKVDFDVAFTGKVTYTAEVLAQDGSALEGETVTFTDAEGNVVATATTDAEGKVSVELPANFYTVTATVPAGYTSVSYDVNDEEINALFTAGPYALDNFYTTMTMAGGTFEGYIVEIPAGETMNFVVRVNGTKKFSITGNWDVAVQYGVQYITPNMMTGNLEIDFVGNMMLDGGMIYFSITNNNAEMATTVMATLVEPVAGASRDNAIEVTEDVTVYTANVDLSVLPEGCVYYLFVPTVDGTLKVSSTASVAAFSIENFSTSVYNDRVEADELTNAENPAVDTMEVSSYDIIFIVVGTNNWASGEYDITIEFTPASAE